MKANSQAILEWLDQRGSLPNIHPSLRSGITILRVPNELAAGSTSVRQVLADNRIIASTFPERLLRLSMPKVKLSLSQMSTLQRALCRLATL
jgi:hypothetical protein